MDEASISGYGIGAVKRAKERRVVCNNREWPSSSSQEGDREKEGRDDDGDDGRHGSGRVGRAHRPHGGREGSASEFEFWRWAVSPMFDIGPADPETYRMQTTVSFVGPIAVSATVSSAMSLDRSSRIIARGGVDDVVVQIYHEGGHLFSFGGREIEVFAGDIALIDLTRPCRILAQSFRNASLVLRRSALKAFDIDVESLHGGILRRGSVLNTLLREYMASLAAHLPDAAASETDRIARGTASLVAASFGPSERREQERFLRRRCRWRVAPSRLACAILILVLRRCSANSVFHAPRFTRCSNRSAACAAISRAAVSPEPSRRS